MAETPRAWAAALAWALMASVAHAQEAPPPDATPTVAADDTSPAAPASGPPPIMVVVLADARVAEPIVAAVGEAVVASVTPMAGGRPVHALGVASMRDAIAACTDDACVGGQLAAAGAQAGILVRLATARRAIAATIELRDPVSGAPRREPITGTLPRTEEGIAEAIAPLAAQLEAAMPSPPPPPSSLLVTVNVDGAQVTIDGADVGTSPVAAASVAAGPHDVVVRADGHLAVQRRVEVSPGEQARLDITLRAMGEEVDGAAAASGESAWTQGDRGGDGGGSVLEEWWLWTIVAGAAVLLGVGIGVGVWAGSQGGEPLDPMGIELPPIEGGL